MQSFYSTELGFDLWIDIQAALKNPAKIRGFCPDETDQHILSECLTHFSNLEYLDLSDTLADNVPESVFALTKLKVLKLNTGDPYGTLQYLEQLPDSIGNLTGLEELDLSGQQQLTCLPASLSRLSNLRILNLNSTGLKQLPDNLDQLQQLENLQLRWVLQLEKLPESICELN